MFTTVPADQTFDTAKETFQMHSKHYVKEGWHKYVFKIHGFIEYIKYGFIKDSGTLAVTYMLIYVIQVEMLKFWEKTKKKKLFSNE